MNERIKELARQCYETGPLGKDGWPEYTKFNEEKFAELIVRKCGKIAEDITYESEGFTFEIDTKLLSHFGIKE